MSVKAMAEVWEHSKSQGNALVLMLAIADHVNESTGDAWPSIKRLASYCNIDRSTVIRNINALIKAGELSKVPGDGRENTRYRITLHNSCGRTVATSRTRATPAVAPVPPLQSHPCDTIPYRTVNDPLKNNKGDFDAFWSQYPNRVAKGAAKTAYSRALKKVSHDDIMAGLARYNPNPQFICNPATWLNQERWSDEHINLAKQSDDAERIGRTSDAFEKAAHYFAERDAQAGMGDRREAAKHRDAPATLIDVSGMDSDDDAAR
jgi:hypothetical protein